MRDRTTMPSLDFKTIRIGDALPSFETEPVSRLALALYCGASGDHNPIHVDLDFARSAGLDDVFAHGMLSMAYLARLLTNWMPQHALRDYGVRFVAITHVGDRVTCRGTVVGKTVVGDETQWRVELQTVDQTGRVTLTGHATLAHTHR